MSRRSNISDLMAEGDAILPANRRAPIAVFVLSITFNREPFFSPDNVLVISRDRRVAGSISKILFFSTKTGDFRNGFFESWV